MYFILRWITFHAWIRVVFCVFNSLCWKVLMYFVNFKNIQKHQTKVIAIINFKTHTHPSCAKCNSSICDKVNQSDTACPPIQTEVHFTFWHHVNHMNVNTILIILTNFHSDMALYLMTNGLSFKISNTFDIDKMYGKLSINCVVSAKNFSVIYICRRMIGWNLYVGWRIQNSAYAKTETYVKQMGGRPLAGRLPPHDPEKTINVLTSMRSL